MGVGIPQLKSQFCSHLLGQGLLFVSSGHSRSMEHEPPKRKMESWMKSVARSPTQEKIDKTGLPRNRRKTIETLLAAV